MPVQKIRRWAVVITRNGAEQFARLSGPKGDLFHDGCPVALFYAPGAPGFPLEKFYDKQGSGARPAKVVLEIREVSDAEWKAIEAKE
jgi:hypothetical protein